MKILIIGSLIAVLISTAAHASSGWFIYYEGDFRGKVIDAETKKPLEGAVVVAVYNINCLGFGHGGSVTVGAKETLTNKNGEFHLRPNLSCYILPWCVGGNTTFTIYKPGYGNFPNQQTYPPPLSVPGEAIFFSAGIDAERWLEAYGDGKYEYEKLKTGIVELPKLRTMEERKQAWMDADIFGANVKARELPLLYKMITEESEKF